MSFNFEIYDTCMMFSGSYENVPTTEKNEIFKGAFHKKKGS